MWTTLAGMRIAISIITLLAACHAPDAPKTPASPPAGSATSAAPTSPAEAPRIDENDLEAVANQFMTASLHGNRKLASHLMLSYDELVALTTKPIVRADYEHEVSDFLDGHVREGKQGGEATIAAKVVRVQKREPSEKLRRATEFAVVKFVVTEDGATHEGPMFFVRTAAGWRCTWHQ
jgi:hypothetical protein